MANTFDRNSTEHARDWPGLHVRTDWRAATWAGLIAGLIFLMAEMLLVWAVQGMSPWAPPRMMAAMALGPGILPPPADFSLAAVITAMLIHFPLSVIYALVLGWAIHRLEMGAALLAGAAFGLIAVYAVNFYVVAPMAFPWFIEARNWISVISHAVFGLVLAGSYVVLRRD